MSDYDKYYYDKYYGLDYGFPKSKLYDDWILCPVCKAKTHGPYAMDHIAAHADHNIISPHIVRDIDNHWQCAFCGGSGTADQILNHMIMHHAHVVAELVMKHYTMMGTPLVNEEDKPLTEKESLEKLEKACEGCTGDEACCAIAGLKLAGWTVEKAPAINADGRKGFIITALEPLKKDNANVPEPRPEPDRK